MKNYNDFINQNINEGLFSWLGKMFKKAAEKYRKVQGGNEIKSIHDKYMKLIEDEIKKQANVDLEFSGEEKSKEQQKKSVQTVEKFILDYNNFILNEAETKTEEQNKQEDQGDLKQENPNEKQPDNEKPNDEQNKTKEITDKTEEGGDKTMTAETLKKKSQIIQKIIDINVNKALKEMDNVLQKKGGAEKNPQLKVLIDLQKDEFQMAYLNAQVKYLEKSGDKNAINKIAAERNKLAKTLDAKYNTLDKTESINIKTEDGREFVVGKPYRYKTADGIKTIKITKKSDNPDEIIATYVSDKFGKTEEQSFKLANIEKNDEFKPTIGDKYKYFSKDRNDIIDVEIVTEPDDKGLVKVKTDKGEFNVLKGALGSKVETTEKK